MNALLTNSVINRFLLVLTLLSILVIVGLSVILLYQAFEFVENLLAASSQQASFYVKRLGSN